MILLIDNYDSFTYNLYHYIIEAGKKDVKVVRNDKITIKEIEKLNPQAIIISPGPSTPDNSGICLELIEYFKEKLPILGICLGHQAIGQVFGAKIIKNHPMHGKISAIYHQKEGIFEEIPSPFNATRYHSLIIDKKSSPDCLKITANTEDGIIMGIEHEKYNIHGLQFHPESIASEYGHKLIENFLKRI